jgi:hypothetical protein
MALCLAASSSRAEVTPPLAPESSAQIVQAPYAQLSVASAPVVPQPALQQAAVRQEQSLSTATVAPAASKSSAGSPAAAPAILPVQYVPPPAGEPLPPALTYVPPDPHLPPPPCCEVCGCTDGCCLCTMPWYRSGWHLGLELYGLRSQLTDSAFGRWPDDGGGAGRISLGYEWPSGFGIRGSSWGFGQDASLPGPDVDLRMGAFHLDFYKSFVGGHNELVIGAGPAAGHVEFRVPSLNDHTEFRAGGASAFAEGYYPFYRRPLWELAFVGQTRLSLIAGDWRDNGGGLVDDTDGDSMSIWEIGFGLEFRHRCGACNNHYWFIQAMPEYQQWTSEWMGDQLGSSIALTGMNVELGFAW